MTEEELRKITIAFAAEYLPEEVASLSECDIRRILEFIKNHKPLHKIILSERSK